MRQEVVICTGAAGNLGRLLVQELHRIHHVVAVDRRPITGLPKDVTHLRTDVRWRAIEDVFRTRNVVAVVHLGLMHNPRGEATVMVVGADDKVAERVVTADRAINGEWLITAGLMPGERVVLDGLQKIKPGSAVRAVPAAEQGNADVHASTPSEVAQR